MRRQNEAQQVAESLTELEWDILAEVRRYGSPTVYNLSFHTLVSKGLVFEQTTGTPSHKYFLTEFGKDVWRVELQ